MERIATTAIAIALAFATSFAPAQEAPAKPDNPVFDAALAKQAGGNENGMRRYVLVILKTGPNRMPDGDARKAMFAGLVSPPGRSPYVWTSNARALAAGMTVGPLAATVTDLLAWFRAFPVDREAKSRAGITREKEAIFLGLWKARQTG